MPQGVLVYGHGRSKVRIEAALRNAGYDTESGHRVAVVADWPNPQALYGLSDCLTVPWILVEDAGGGTAAVGPLFHRGRAGCFDCYVARRRANGGKECRPPESLSEAALGQIRDQVAAFFASQSVLSGEQIEVAPGGEVARHTFLPVPSCPACASADPEERDLTCESLVGNRLGLVHEVRFLPGVPESLVAALASGCRTDAFLASRAMNRGMAVDETAAQARGRAIGESIERYCAAAMPEDAPFARAMDLEGAYLDPQRLGPLQGEWDPETSAIRWVCAYSLIGDHPIWVPASAVFIPYGYQWGEPTIEMQSSVGIAAHPALDEAILRGLAEILERDACLRAWRWRLPVEAVHDRPIAADGLRLARVPNNSGLQVVAAFLERGDPPLTSTGMAARQSLRDAARHATLEAILSQLWLRDWLETNGHEHPCVPRTMIDNAVAHAVRADLRASRCRWLSPGRSAAIDGDTLPWTAVLDRTPEACFVDLTTPDVAVAGIRVVRVLVPDKVLSDDDALRSRLGGDPTPHPFG
jgi:bacteriocin biosynthesis cyclodehydratase domain-containing protein